MTGTKNSDEKVLLLLPSNVDESKKQEIIREIDENASQMTIVNSNYCEYDFYNFHVRSCLNLLIFFY